MNEPRGNDIETALNKAQGALADLAAVTMAHMTAADDENVEALTGARIAAYTILAAWGYLTGGESGAPSKHQLLAAAGMLEAAEAVLAISSKHARTAAR